CGRQTSGKPGLPVYSNAQRSSVPPGISVLTSFLARCSLPGSRKGFPSALQAGSNENPGEDYFEKDRCIAPWLCASGNFTRRTIDSSGRRPPGDTLGSSVLARFAERRYPPNWQ